MYYPLDLKVVIKSLKQSDKSVISMNFGVHNFAKKKFRTYLKNKNNFNV
jgi:hypothetical protein